MDFVRQVVRFYSEHLLKKKLDQEKKIQKAISEYLDKPEVPLRASELVRRQKQYLEALQGFHSNQYEVVDWQKILQEPQPEILEQYSANYDAAIESIAEQQPGFLKRILGRGKLSDSYVEQSLEKAQEIDSKTVIASKLTYTDWVNTLEIARGVLAADPSAYKEAMDYFHLFQSLKTIGVSLQSSLNEGGLMIYFHPNLAHALPQSQHTLSQGRKLQTKPFSQQALHYLQSEYIAAVALRIAIEAFSFLPIQSVAIDGLSEPIFDSSISQNQNIIFSLIIDRAELSKLSVSKSAIKNLKQFRYRFINSQWGGFVPISSLVMSK